MKQDTRKNIFILLTRTSTPFSKAIRLVTHCDYTHASLGLYENSLEFFSFGRKEAYTLPTTAGFITENLVEGVLYRNQNSPCILYKLSVTNEVYKEIEERVRTFEMQPEQYSYSFLGTVLCYFNVPHAIKNKYFCSQFVAEILNETRALPLDKNPSLYHPSDFLKEANLEVYYEGTIKELTQFLEENSNINTYYEYTKNQTDYYSHGET
jgi:hypothetical protein